MASRFFRGLGFLAYAVVLCLVFGLAAYTSFSLFVRSGVTSVPPLKGLSRIEATNRLADQGLRLRRVEERGRYDDRVPAGHVVRHSPDARTLVKRGSSVTVILSLGPQRVEVPELDGRSLPAAQAALSGSGLGLGSIHLAFAGGVQPGTILEQDPDPGARIAPTTGVDLLLAMPAPGERFIMPDLIYRDYESVRPLFEQRGFHFGSVKFERYEGVAAGVILRQFPLPGHPVTRDNAVSLVVATADNLPDTVTGTLPLPQEPAEPQPPQPPQETDGI
jgi:eukaryotic-like serine/threonine-protein kinase